ncbi:MAG: competence/damage-inducible protein A [Bacteroidales bacterium]|nr:competence/damage-inducible protein A [Bacteroidales bacterium]
MSPKKSKLNDGQLVEIITIGDEILIGQIVDTNSAWMAKELNKDGFRIVQITTVPDNESCIMEAVDMAFKRADIILVTGGLGPTKDDITKQTLCKYFHTRMVFNQEVIDNINELFADRPNVLNELTYGQANVPESAIIIQNKRGTAPVTWFDKNNKILVSMPGVPSEMMWIMSNEIMPRLKAHFSTPALMHQTVLVYGIPESSLAIKLTDWENALPAFIRLAYLPKPGLVKLRMTGFLPDKDQLKDIIGQELVKLRQILGTAILAEEDAPEEVIIGKLLKDKGLQLSTAESCTGGNIAHMITSVAGSSAYFKGSVVAYSNEVKEKVLGVSPATIDEFGAVSQEVVEQMAKGVLKQLNADVAVSVSGIAGPDGGTEEKPVGTVWICVCTQTDMISRRFQFGHLRNINISRATLSAFAMIKEIIEKSTK